MTTDENNQKQLMPMIEKSEDIHTKSTKPNNRRIPGTIL